MDSHILCLETSTTNCSVAIFRGDECLSSIEHNEGYKHAELIYSMTSKVLNASNLKITDIDAFAVGKGPGSYTGLRIGVSFVKGLAFAQFKPVITIDSLENLANNPKAQEHSGLVVPMIDARRMEVYDAIYQEGKCLRQTKAEVLDKESFSDMLRDQKLLFLGDGAIKCKELFDHPNALFLDDAFPSSINMGTLAFRKLKQNDFEDLAYVEPYYLKDFVAGKPRKLL